jgi:hypothetical protein
MASYDEIVSNKSSLEFEINTYRRLLESEEAHVRKAGDISSHTKQTISSTSTFVRQTDYTPPPPPPPTKQVITVADTKINQTEMQAKTTFQRSAKGFFLNLNQKIFVLTYILFN